ncbi:MAG: CapA family protein [Halapricum sp.]
MHRTRRGALAAGAACLTGCFGATRQSDQGFLNGGSANVRLGFVGDVMLGRGVNDRWAGDDPIGVWGSTLERLRRLDGLVLNLECCISERGDRWPNKSYYFRADPAFAVRALDAVDSSVAALANNHVLDFREPALRDTRTHLSEAGIAHAGAGPNIDVALDPAVVDVGGLTVAMFSLTDRFSTYAATENNAGTAYVPFEVSAFPTDRLVREVLDRVRDHAPDLVVASLHWGPNWETSPDASQQAFARWLVDLGVDVVHGHSAHVLQGVEVYRGRPILYDAGDFVDDYVQKEELQNKRSALFELVVTDGQLAGLGIVPIEIENATATLADGEAAAWVRQTMRERSERFGTTLERADDGLSISFGTC